MRYRALAVLVLSAAAAQADDRVRDGAAKVYAAVRNDASLTLERLAAKDHPDPWLIAEELCFHGKYGAAAAWATATRQERLAAYVVSRRSQEADPEARRAVGAAHRLRIGNYYREAWQILKDVEPPGDPVLEVRLQATRAKILRDLGDHPRSDQYFLDAGKLAHELGWRRGASAALRYLACRACFGKTGDGKVGGARNHLAEGEATVVYGTVLGELLATVITAERAWYVPVGKADEIEAACRAFPEPAPGVPVVANALGHRLVRPLGLGKEIRRLFIEGRSPFKELPWVLFVDGREVAYGDDISYVTALHPWKGEVGRDVLALGIARGAGDHRAEQEAHAVGNVALTGAFTPATLDAALGTRHHWRAVHVALPSQLAAQRLTLEDIWNNGGQRKEPRIDLVVWSTPTPPRGPWRDRRPRDRYEGPPRVIRTLWDVDSEATFALMTKFYELWNGKTPLPACTALKRAQDFVRSHEQWKHPYYWAGWQLWAARDPEKTPPDR
jgi:hypothetical protein